MDSFVCFDIHQLGTNMPLETYFTVMMIYLVDIFQDNIFKFYKISNYKFELTN